MLCCASSARKSKQNANRVYANHPRHISDSDQTTCAKLSCKYRQFKLGQWSRKLMISILLSLLRLQLGPGLFFVHVDHKGPVSDTCKTYIYMIRSSMYIIIYTHRHRIQTIPSRPLLQLARLHVKLQFFIGK